MSESSQNDQPVIFWISMPPAVGNGGAPVDVPTGSGPGQPGAPCPPPEPTAGPPCRPGVFISYIVLQVLAVVTVGGVAGLLIAWLWPQASGALALICAVIGAGLALLDIMMKQGGNGRNGGGR